MRTSARPASADAVPRPRRVLGRAALAVACGTATLGLAACDRAAPAATTGPATLAADRVADAAPSTEAAEIRMLAAGRGIVPLASPAPVRPELVALGQALVFDRILSGNRNIACMTCHLPAMASGDARSLPIGEGGVGLGRDRRLEHARIIPRNAPPLFNVGAMRSLFWDGRVDEDADGGRHTPAGAQLSPRMIAAFEFGAVSAQGLFPVTARDEMRGFDARPGNELAAIPDDDLPSIWRALMARLGAVPEYRRMFEAAYPGTPFREMTFAHATNAMAGFMIGRLSFNRSPWDRFLAGDDAALSPGEMRGARLFMTARCSLCHNGATFSDEKFHNVALAQFGPGKGNGPSGHDDFGRENVTGLAADRYAFRTTPLRNVELSGPYGHAGQFVDLRSFVAHYSESAVKLQRYDVRQVDPILRSTLLDNVRDVLATRDTLLQGVVFTPQQITDVTTYMRALTDPAARNLRGITPRRVPSGLPVDGQP